MTKGGLLNRVTWTAFVMTFAVVVLGAWVRLSDAGLGCPDWPGCYGQILVPNQSDTLQAANAAFPHRPVEAGKAWKEMIHRYVAGLLGLVILLMTALSWLRREQSSSRPTLATTILCLVGLQALLGMWTVTLLLKPLIVLGHLLGGLTVLSLLWWYVLAQSAVTPGNRPEPAWLRLATLVCTLILVFQIALGGWTSTNYSALVCTGFPACAGQWWPAMDPIAGFTPWRGLGINYEFGVLENPGRIAIHMAHRMWALVTFGSLGALGILLIRFAASSSIRRTAVVILVLLVIQVTLGIANVTLYLPLANAVAHTGFAAVLLLSLVTLGYLVVQARTAEH